MNLTINLLDSQQVIHGQFEVVGVHVLVEGSHDGRGVIGVLKAQRVAKFMHRHQEQIVTFKQKKKSRKKGERLRLILADLKNNLSHLKEVRVSS